MDIARLKQKRQLINTLRHYFEQHDFFELETPLLVPSPGMEVHLHPFRTDYYSHAGDTTTYYLPTSPEFALKKALGAGFEKIFEIARVFRNQGELGPEHHPEFNMLEWYRPGDYTDIMDDVDDLLKYIGSKFSGIAKDPDFIWDQGCQRTSIEDCFKRYSDLNLSKGLQDLQYWRHAATKVLEEHVPVDDSFDDIFFRVWLKLIEPRLGATRPQIVYDYPASMSALAQLKAPENIWAERFELYIKGIEIGNAFGELVDSTEQLRRFEQANTERKALGFTAHPIDHDLIEAVGKMPPTGGIAIGVERLLMVLTGSKDIRDFFLYPLGDSNLI